MNKDQHGKTLRRRLALGAEHVEEEAVLSAGERARVFGGRQCCFVERLWADTPVLRSRRAS